MPTCGYAFDKVRRKDLFELLGKLDLDGKDVKIMQTDCTGSETDRKIN